MKSTDLRIGNYIYNNEGEITKVALLGADLVMVDDSKKVIEKNCAPIPLTEDWLLRFGFESSGDDGYNTDWNNGNITIVEGVDYFIEDKTGVNIEYVHQLQNLYYALTGAELTQTI